MWRIQGYAISNTRSRAGVLRQFLPAQDVIQMVLHVQHVILDQESQRDGIAGTDVAMPKPRRMWVVALATAIKN